MLKYKFYSYIAYMMISIYWVSYYNSKLSKNKGLEQFEEEDFKHIFKFKTKKEEEDEY
jgi:uncharacterized ion transporter superfamily protein YfcC